MEKHTPEPWAIYPNSITRKTLSAADYQRARAAVNACAGIPTEALEADVVRRMREAIYNYDSLLHALTGPDDAAAQACIKAGRALLRSIEGE